MTKNVAQNKNVNAYYKRKTQTYQLHKQPARVKLIKAPACF